MARTAKCAAALALLLAVLLLPGQAMHAAEPADSCSDELGLEPYRSNYLLPWVRDRVAREGRLADEAKFQISLRKRLLRCVPLYLAYTQLSAWQVYDEENSRPFRESLYQPEVFLRWQRPLDDRTRISLQTGLEHGSNGQPLPFSRSWNRVYAWPTVTLNDAGLSLGVKAWRRLPEETDEPTTPEQPVGDDNPDIVDYLGHGELYVGWRLPWHPDTDPLELRLMLRKGKQDEHGTYQADLLTPVAGLGAGLYLQLHYFYGYGETLIDYDRRVNKIGIGFAFR